MPRQNLTGDKNRRRRDKPCYTSLTPVRSDIYIYTYTRITNCRAYDLLFLFESFVASVILKARYERASFLGLSHLLHEKELSIGL